jgi:hypothetical protein
MFEGDLFRLWNDVGTSQEPQVYQTERYLHEDKTEIRERTETTVKKNNIVAAACLRYKDKNSEIIGGTYAY